MIKILGSIKNLDEASLISDYNFDIIDIKNIDDGALGYVGNKEIKLIAHEMTERTLSVTAGNEIHPNNIEMENKLELLSLLGIAYIKIGIFDMSLLEQHKLFLKKATSYNIKTVGVIFADNKPQIKDIDSICDLDYDGLMIDTISKSKYSTLDILGEKLLSYFIVRCHNLNKFCGLSGSLNYKNIEKAMNFKPDFIGLRGALCSLSKREDIEINQCGNIINRVEEINQRMCQEAV